MGCGSPVKRPVGEVERERPQPRPARRRREEQSRAVRRERHVGLFAGAGRQAFGAIEPLLRHRIDGDAPDVLAYRRRAPRNRCYGGTRAQTNLPGA